MHRHLPAILIVALLLAFRVAGILFPEALPNFQPLAAVFFCGALLAPGWRGFALPMGIWAVTYPFGVGPVYSPSIFATTLLAFVAIFFLGKALVPKGKGALLLGSIAAAAVFHLITCTASWLGDPMLYQKTLSGFWQSVWTGPIGSKQPSWIFLKNLAAANLIFTAIFVVSQVRAPKPETAGLPVGAE